MVERYKPTKFDGIHMYGPSGMKSYTASVMKILSSAKLVEVIPPKYYDEYEHKTCNQARYQTQHNRRNNQQKNSKTKTKTKVASGQDYQYEVPTFNRFAKLGDFIPKNL